MAGVKKAGDILSSLFNEQFDPQTLRTARITAGLFSSWAIAAKDAHIPAASDHSRIRDFDRGVLLIEAEHPGWIQLLQTKQDRILQMYQKKYPELEIQGVSFCLSKTPISQPLPPASNVMQTAIAEQSNETAADEKTEAAKSNYESIKNFEKIIRKRSGKF